MAFIGLGMDRSKYWFFLLSTLFYLFRSYLFRANYSCDPLIKVLFMSVGMMLSLLLAFVSKKLNNTQNSYRVMDTGKLTLKILLAIFSLNLLDSIGFFLLNYGSNFKGTFYGIDELHILLQFFIVAVILFFLKKLIMYKHHIFFVLFMVIGLVIILCSNLADRNIEANLNILFQVFSSCLYAVLLVGEKWLMEYKFISPYILVGLEGLFSFITTGIILLLRIFVFKDSSYFEKIENFTQAGFIIQAILFIICSLGYNVFVMLINQSFGATNRVVADFLSYFISLIINSIFNLDDIPPQVIAILFFGYLFVSVGTVGFNEIIIFFFYGLEENTYMFIKNRSDNTEKVTQGDLGGRKSCIYMEMKDEERDSL